MFLLVLLLIPAFVLTFWLGFRRLLRLKHLNRRRLIAGSFAAMLILTVMTAAHHWGYFPQQIAARFTMGLYTLVAGFFWGFGVKQYLLKRKSGHLEYVYRSLWAESLPNLISILFIAFGLYRTHLLTLGPFTGIGVTSGLSLIAFGIVGLTIRMVPEFRQKGILILDQLVPWKKVAAYRWQNEKALQIDYLNTDGKLTDFITTIPAEDHVAIERLLSKKMAEHEDKRKQALNRPG